MADAEAVASLAGQLGYPTTADQATARLTDALSNSRDAVFVGVRNGVVSAWLHVHGVHCLLSDPFGEVSGLVVDASTRGLGLGAMLLDRAIQWAREQGYRKLRIRTNIIRHDAHRFYEIHGCRLAKTQHVYEITTTEPR
jgi:GNAT superfamily N-acetyltransferase